jgi:CHAD domain-containing protein
VLLDALEGERATARAAMLEALTAPRFFALLERLAGTVSAPLPAPERAGPDQHTLVDLVRAEARKLRRAVARAGDDPPDEVLHALRIRGKRVRYTGELVAPSLVGAPNGKAVKRLLAATAALQEVLGDHQDACVAEQRVRGLLADLDATPDTVFVAGRLVEREIHRATEKRGEWWAAWVLVDARIEQV